MYVCLCHGITDTEIKRLVRCGEVCSMRDLATRHGVGTQCGKCTRCAKDVVREALAECQGCDMPMLAAA